MRIEKAIWLGWLVLALAGCSSEPPPPPAAAASPVASERPSPSPAVTAATVSSPAEPAAVDTAPAAEIASARRLEDARTYLDQARVAAEERHRLAVAACATPGQGDRDLCTAAADDALQAELQAARAEFEAQMRQPN